MAVLIYHANSQWLPGGYLGVEVFFVISGYLITSLLLAERRTTGRTSLFGFWSRRARRLLPALFSLLIGVTVYSVIFLPREVALLREALLAALTYVSNWYLIFNHESYFELFGRPSLLRHLWSLAVEEQFYLVWPLAFSLVLGRLRTRYAVSLLLSGAIGSAALMAALYDPVGDASRVYYGTDTRASGLLIGAALAFVMSPAGARILPGRWWASLPAIAPVAALFALFATLGDSEAFLYRGGFLLTDVVTAGVIVVAVRMAGTLPGRVFASRPFVWVGLRSYAIYLWHWPVFMLTRQHLDIELPQLELFALRLAITLAIAHASYVLIERPMRTGALTRIWQFLKPKRPISFPGLYPRPLAFLSTVTIGVVVLGMSVAAAEPPGRPSYLPTDEIKVSSWSEPNRVSAATLIAQNREPVSDDVGLAIATASPAPGAPASASTVLPAIVTATENAPADVVPPAAPTSSSQPLPVSDARVFAVGDSVMLSAAPSLVEALPNMEFDAAVSRQVEEGIGVLRARRDAGLLGDIVVIHLGTNGAFTTSEFEEIMSVTAGVPRVIFINLKVPRDWEGGNNSVIAEGVARFPNARLIDWRGLSDGHPEYFYEDEIHLERSGGDAYATLIANATK